MSRRYLGDTLDIHTGGPDNKFPHHECEIAQSESVTGLPFVRHWIHCGWLEIGGEKMSKRAGPCSRSRSCLEKGYTGADLRLYLLRTHYRSPLPFDLSLLDEAAKTRTSSTTSCTTRMASVLKARTSPRWRRRSSARRDFAAALETT